MSKVCREVNREIIAPADIKETMSDWHAAALAVVQKSQTVKKPKKLFRSSAYKFLLALDNSINICCGYALSAYRFARHWCINGCAGEFVMVADPPLHYIAHFTQEVHAEPGFGLGVNCKWCVHA